jgi:hypothetical protein
MKEPLYSSGSFFKGAIEVMNDYIFYLEYFNKNSNSPVGWSPVGWVYDRATAGTFPEAYALHRRNISAASKINSITYKLIAAELYNKHAVPALASKIFKERAEQLLRIGIPFPESFVLPSDGDSVDTPVEKTPTVKRKEPEICLEVFFKGDRSHVDFSKITADLSKAPR